KVSNLVACMKDLKKKNIWIYGAEMEGTSWCELDLANGGVALVIGSEGNGLSRLIKEECDFFATLPMCGQINSLNASVAAGILMYEVARQRIYKNK
ncbi:MAG: TrmH family RNA methyltransferase, partial [Oscillospiraceae bacterium]